jgi:oligosaccharide repeat unit polymerase
MALVVVNCGLLAFTFTSLRFGRAAFQIRRDPFIEVEKRELTRPFLLLCAGLLPIVAYSFYRVWAVRMNGNESIFLVPGSGVFINVSGNGYTQGANIVCVSVAAILAWLFRFRIWSLLPLAAFVFFRAGTGGRGPIALVLACLASFYLFEFRKRWPGWRVIVLAVLGFVIFNAVGSDRGRAVRDLVTAGETRASQAHADLKPMEGMDFANMEYVEYLTDMIPRRTGTYEYFVDQLQIFTEPIPRALWKGKPVGQPIRLFNLFDYGFPIGMTYSLPGEGWKGLGLLGVVFWCGLWGAVLGAIYNAWAVSRQGVIGTSAYFALLAMLILFYRDGIPITVFRAGVFIVTPVPLWAGIARLMGATRAKELRRLALERAGGAGEDHLARGGGPGPDSRESPAPAPRSARHAQSVAVVPRAWRRRTTSFDSG